MIASLKSAAVLVSMMALFASAGCNDAKKPSSGNAPLLVVDLSSPPSAKSGSNVPAAGTKAATDEANAFLKLLTAGDAKSAVEKISAPFRKEVSGPLTFEDEKKLGYSDSDTERYLKAASAGASKAEVKAQVVAPSGNTVALRGDLAGPEPRSFSLRLAKEGDAWKVTRFTTAKVVAVALPKDAGNPELLWARQSALDFLESLVGGGEEQTLTMAGMSEDLKAGLPAPSIADAGLKYAKKDVRNWLNSVKSGATGFAIAREEMPGAGAVFTGELTGGAKSAPVRLELSRDGDNWKIAKFDVSQ